MLYNTLNASREIILFKQFSNLNVMIHFAMQHSKMQNFEQKCLKYKIESWLNYREKYPIKAIIYNHIVKIHKAEITYYSWRRGMGRQGKRFVSRRNV